MNMCSIKLKRSSFSFNCINPIFCHNYSFSSANKIFMQRLKKNTKFNNHFLKENGNNLYMKDVIVKMFHLLEFTI